MRTLILNSDNISNIRTVAIIPYEGKLLPSDDYYLSNSLPNGTKLVYQVSTNKLSNADGLSVKGSLDEFPKKEFSNDLIVNNVSKESELSEDNLEELGLLEKGIIFPTISNSSTPEKIKSSFFGYSCSPTQDLFSIKVDKRTLQLFLWGSIVTDLTDFPKPDIIITLGPTPDNKHNSKNNGIDFIQGKSYNGIIYNEGSYNLIANTEITPPSNWRVDDPNRNLHYYSSLLNELFFENYIWANIYKNGTAPKYEVNIANEALIKSLNPGRNLSEFCIKRSDYEYLSSAELKYSSSCCDYYFYKPLSVILGKHESLHKILTEKLTRFKEKFSKKVSYKRGNGIVVSNETYISLGDNNKSIDPRFSPTWALEESIKGYYTKLVTVRTEPRSAGKTYPKTITIPLNYTTEKQIPFELEPGYDFSGQVISGNNILNIGDDYDYLEYRRDSETVNSRLITIKNWDKIGDEIIINLSPTERSFVKFRTYIDDTEVNPDNTTFNSGGNTYALSSAIQFTNDNSNYYDSVEDISGSSKLGIKISDLTNSSLELKKIYLIEDWSRSTTNMESEKLYPITNNLYYTVSAYFREIYDNINVIYDPKYFEVSDQVVSLGRNGFASLKFYPIVNPLDGSRGHGEVIVIQGGNTYYVTPSGPLTKIGDDLYEFKVTSTGDIEITFNS